MKRFAILLQAALHGYTDPEVVHTWKSNSLPLRFWVNLIKNPYFVFDIPRADKIDGKDYLFSFLFIENFEFAILKSRIKKHFKAFYCSGSLSVVAQTLMDACSTQDHQHNRSKDAPSSKLLFIQSVPMYREWVDKLVLTSCFWYYIIEC